MNQHEGVQCDVCGRTNFRGCRYKCLICTDYDLCSECFDRGLSSGSHMSGHPMQSILTRNDMSLFFGGEDLNGAKIQCLTCPYCGELGLTGKTLMKHLIYRHPSLGESDSLSPVLCPLCANLMTGNNNYTTTNLPGHLVVEHRIAGPRALVESIDDVTVTELRNPQPLPSSTQTQRRSGTSRSNRNSMDAVFLELMSHLPDVRFDSRSGGGGSTISVQALQQIQMQLHQHQLEHRMARRAALSGQIPPDFVPERYRAPPPAERPPSNTSRRTSSNARPTNAALALQAAIASEARRYNISGTGRRNAPPLFGNAEPMDVSGAGDNAENTNININSSRQKKFDAGRPHLKAEEDDKFVLTKFLRQDLNEFEHAQLDQKRADRSLFVQALLMSAFASDFQPEVESDSPDKNTASENIEVKSSASTSSSKIQIKEKKSKKKKNRKNKHKKQYEGVCVGAVGQSGSKVLSEALPLEGACVDNSEV